MRIGLPAFILSTALLAMSAFSVAQEIPDLPPLDPGALIGTPTPEGNGGENIPVAVPADEEFIPVAVPVNPLPGQAPTQLSQQFKPVIPQTTFLPVDQNLTQVAILGYHDFSEIKPATEMRIRTSVFREQMQALKDSNIPVISLGEFLEWKKGSRNLPEFCVMITIDDGWKSVYTDAYPILQEMGFPFTMFVYTNFLTGRGSSLSLTEVKEMMRGGATVGSHSTSHLYPSSWKSTQRKGAEQYKELIDKEIGKSKTWLEQNLSTEIQAYCYPGGYHTPEMIETLPGYGYSFAVTVIPRKTLHQTNDWEVPRYIVHGNNIQTFKRAVTFTKTAQHLSAGDNPGETMVNATLPAPPYPVEPVANTTTTNNTPNISIELPNPHDILADSVEMKVSGFGKVPAKIADNTATLLWKPNRPLRTDVVHVKVSWRYASTKARETVEWEFGVKSEAASMLMPANVVK